MSTNENKVLPVVSDEAVQALEEESRIDALRIQAFKTNADADKQAYFDAVSKWFQSRYDRATALPHLQTGYALKQLEWAEGGKGLAVRKFFSTNRMYSITENHGGSFIVETDNSSRSLGSKGNLKAAKELAQADFERRVSECIVGGVDVATLDLSVLETLSEKADEFDIPDELGPWPDIQDAMITVGDLRKVRRLLKDFQSLSATPTDGVEVRRQALEEEEFALKVAEEMIVARDRRIKELEGQLIKKTEECAVLANSLDVSAATTEEEENDDGIKTDTSNISLRDYFAVKAMQAQLPTVTEYPDEHWRVGVALDAYAMADAMVIAKGIFKARQADAILAERDRAVPDVPELVQQKPTDERCLETELEVAELKLAELEMHLELKTDECAQLANSLDGSEHLRKAAEADNKRLREALEELSILMQDVIDGKYIPDSFTLQPARAALEGSMA